MAGGDGCQPTDGATGRGGVRLRPLAGADRDLLARWLQSPEVRRWWGSAASAQAEIGLALDSAAAICRMIEQDGVAIGYAHAIEAGLLGGGLPEPIGPGTWDCEVFIGSEPHRGRGFGQQALEALVGEVFTTTLAVACSIVVSVRNEQAARAYERAGFRWVWVWDDPIVGPSWVMLREREPPRPSVR